MKTAKKHIQESERIKALNSTSLLDSQFELEFDSIAYLASQICEAPIALISLVDSERQWFKAKVGLEAKETPRDYAFCAHAILSDDLFIVEDSTRDERFFDNPLVTGEPRVVFYAGAPLKDPGTGLPLGTVCVIDHQARQLSENQKNSLLMLSNQVSHLIDLRKKIIDLEDQKLRLKRSFIAIENMQEGFVLQDKTGAIIDFNPAALKILGLTADQLFGKTSSDPSWQAIKENGDPFPGHEHPAMVALATGQKQSGVKMGVRSSHFQERWISINASPIFIDDHKVPDSVVATFVDNTELQKIQANLMDNARLVSLAEMASGIAHEINNPLAIINGLSANLVKGLSEPEINRESLLKHVGKIKDTVFRASKIIKSLQAFARSGDQEPNTENNLMTILEDTLSLCAEKFKLDSITVNLDVSKDLFVVSNPVRLGQVFLNLLNNSYDVLQDLEQKWISIKAEVTGGVTKVFFQDSGSGIPSQIVSRIFLPFYTTKKVGKGTGLGLPLSKGFIEEMGGQLYYDPSQKHTTFVIELKMK